MDRLTYRRVLWALHRSHLRHGAWMWGSVAAVTMVIGLASAVTGVALRLHRAGIDLAAARSHAMHGAPTVVAADGTRETLPLPMLAARFDITQRILQALDDSALAPEQIHFKFEHAADAGVTRQIAAFSVKTRWSAIAELLDKLQKADRSVYIARLKVERSSTSDEAVDADIQLGVALMGDDSAVGAKP